MAITNSPPISAIPYKEMQTMPTNFISQTEYDFLAKFANDSDTVLHQPYVNDITGFLTKVSAIKRSKSQHIRWGEDRETNIVIYGAARATNTITTTAPHKLRPNIEITIDDGTVIQKAFITATPTETTLTIAPYAASWTVGTADLTIVEGSSDFLPGSYGMQGGLTPEYDIYTNTKRIVKDADTYSKTDSGEALWLEIPGKGFLWTLHRNSKFYKRLSNKVEDAFLNGIVAEAGSGVATAGLGKMKGVFQQTKERGTTFTGYPTTKDEWEEICAILDKQGAITYNSLWNNTEFSFAFSDSIATETENGYGIFQNGKSEAYSYDMKGFELGGYVVMQKKWNYLISNQGMGALAGAGKVNGFMFPMGNKNVFDTVTGEKESVPYLHVETSVDGRGVDRWFNIDPDAADKDQDAYKISGLSEFAAKFVGANNGVIFVSGTPTP